MKGLTTKESLFIQRYVETNKKVQSVFDAGYNIGGQGGKKENRQKTAVAIANKILRKAEARNAIQEMLADYGITKDFVVRRFKELISSGDTRTVKELLDMYFKLTDSYPAGKVKIGAYSEELDDIITEKTTKDKTIKIK